MARPLNKLSVPYCDKKNLRPGRHSDGGGLYLNVSSTGTRSWVFVWTRRGTKREMGLGSYVDVPLKRAREKAAEARRAVEDGRDPIAEREKAEEPTFSQCAILFIEGMEKAWRNEKHRAQWRMTLDRYCTVIRDKRVSEIGTDDVLKVLSPIWQEKNETASRLRGRIERVLDFARARGWRTGENPALWRGHLKNVLPPRQKLARGHHPAMPYSKVPAFVQRLQEAEAMAARALEFLILTASRSAEVYGAGWSEFDLGKGIWTVPPHRMKNGIEHRVPLSGRALDLVTHLYEARTSEYVFPGQRPKKPLSSSAMEMLLRRMKVDQYTVHGFRSAFRDWAGDETGFPREIAEAALAHRVGDATERAYRRADALEKRRKLMQAWADFLAADSTKTIVNLSARRREAVGT